MCKPLSLPDGEQDGKLGQCTFFHTVLLPDLPASLQALRPAQRHIQKDRTHQPLRPVLCKGDLAARPLHFVFTGFSVGNVMPVSAFAKPEPSEDN